MPTSKKIALERLIKDDRENRKKNKLTRARLENEKVSLANKTELLEGKIIGYKAGLVENRIINLKNEILDIDKTMDVETFEKLTAEVDTLQDLQKLQDNIKGIGESDASINQKIKELMKRKQEILKRMDDLDRQLIQLQQEDFKSHEKFMGNLSALEKHMEPKLRRKLLNYMRDELQFEFLVLDKEAGYLEIDLEAKVGSPFLEMYKAIQDLGKLGAALENPELKALATSLYKQLDHIEARKDNMENQQFLAYNAAILKMILHCKDDEIKALENSKFQYVYFRLAELVDGFFKSPTAQLKPEKKVSEQALEEELQKANFKRMI